MSSNRQSIVIGVGSHIVALDSGDGRELWRTRLKSTSFVTVLPSGDQVFAGAGGEAFCLDAATGTILWRNKLKGLGIGLVSFASSGDALQAAALQAQSAAAASAS